MSKRLVLVTVVFSVITGIVLGYMNAVPNDFIDEPVGSDVEYGYRCADGSEFTLVPTEESGALFIVPATSSDYVQNTLLQNVPGGVYNTYVGGDVMLSVREGGIELSVSGHEPTQCTSMLPEEESLFQ